MSFSSDRLSALKRSLIVFTAGIILSVAAAYQHQKFDAAERSAQFERQSAFAFNAIDHQVRAGGQLVRSLQSSFIIADQIDQAAFEELYDSLDPKNVFPSLQAMLFSTRTVTSDGKEHYYTRFVAPKEGNESIVGLDLVIQPPNLTAVKQSEHTGDPVMSAPFVLMQDVGTERAKRRDGITIRVPAYMRGVAKSRNTQLGSMGISFHLSDLIEYALKTTRSDSIWVAVYDEGQDIPLYQSSTRPDTTLVRRENLHYGQQNWVVELRSLRGGVISPWPFVTFFAFALISVLGAMLLYDMLLTRYRALSLANEMSRKFKQSEDRFRLLNENLPGMVLLADRCGVISYTNRFCRERLNVNVEPVETLMEVFSEPDLLGKMEMLMPGDYGLNLPRLELKNQQGESFWASISITNMDLDGEAYLLVLGFDVSEIIEMSARLDFQAKHDHLTGLCNRRYFEYLLQIGITEQNLGIHHLALLYVDLDQFKIINDTAGHMAGDKLLVKAAEGLRQVVGSEHLLARLGGDEFGVLLTSATREEAETLAERIRVFFDGFVFTWEGVPHQVTCSIGVAMLNEPNLSKEEFLSLADTACYIAKDLGRNRWQYLDEESKGEGRREEMIWVGRIRQAMSHRRLSLYYQDIVAIGTEHGGLHCELLIRMEDEHGKIIPAMEFIPAAERYGLMPTIDRWVIETALSNFDHLHPQGPIDTCTINLSGDTIDDPAFETFLLDALARHQVDPTRVCIEITETAAIRNMDRLLTFIPKLRATGCRLALDDFGAGMSSFSYLKNLQVDIIKIDGSFIKDLEHDTMSHSIVQAVTHIAHTMNMKVVAEWVQSQAVVDILVSLGVNYAQGFYLHKPTPCPITIRWDGPA